MKFIDKYTIPTLLEYSFSKYSKNNAYSFVGEKQNTYEDLHKEVNKIGHLLRNLDIKKGDKVAILAVNSPQWVSSYLAISALGAIVVPILPDFSEREVTYILEHSESKAVFVSEKLQERISPLLPIHTIKIENQTILGEEGVGIKYSCEPFPYANVEEEDLLAIIYTSGTTGFSKGVMLSHKNILWNVRQCKIMQEVNEKDRFLSILPLSHTYENTLGMLTSLASGCSTYYLKKLPTPAVLLPALEKIQPTLMLSVPLVIEKIYKGKVLKQINSKKITKFLYTIRPFQKILNKIAGKKLYKSFGGKLKFFGIGGAKVEASVERFLLDSKFPYAIGYGMTETAPLLAGAVGDIRKVGFTGKVAQDVQLRLKKENPEDELGEVQVKGPNIMQGYYKAPHLNEEVFTKDGWLRTGDLGMFDENGMLCIKGRIKTMILGASGENIFPEEIESIINKMDVVSESLVTKKGGKLVAMVHLNMEELENQIKHLHENMLSLKDEAIHYKDDTIKYIEEKSDETKKYIIEKADETKKYLDEKADHTKKYIEEKADDTIKYIEEKSDDTKKYLDEKADHTKKYIEEKTDDTKKFLGEKTDDTKKFIEEKTEETLKEIKTLVNKELNKFSQIQKVVIKKTPFVKTPTHKIKRFLYK